MEHCEYSNTALGTGFGCLPLLDAIDNIVLAIGGLDSRGVDIRHIGACLWLCNRDAYALLSSKQVWEEALLKLLVAELENRGHAKGHSNCDGAARASQSRASHLK